LRVDSCAEGFGDVMTGGVGSTKSSSNMRVTDRRSVGRTAISKGVLLFFSAQRGVFSCEVCDVTNIGAKIKLNGLRLLPPNFELSYDNFRTIRKCRLIWRLGDFVGIAFEN
jgi:hypothetical protein